MSLQHTLEENNQKHTPPHKKINKERSQQQHQKVQK
jgi:hypothetical protein